MAGSAPERLLDSYSDERIHAADENIRNSTRSTDFITPKSRASRTFRNAVLGLARQHAFARSLVNSGRLSVPSLLSDSPLNTPDEDAFEGWMLPGAPMDDAPVQVDGRASWLLREVASPQAGGFVLLVFGNTPVALADAPVELRVVRVGRDRGMLADPLGLVARRYDGRDGTVYLLRPDQHVAARWRRFDAAKVNAALSRALALD
jgi:3-(3-hydroxy-phenyl)propionate hydroxylase